MATGKRKCVVLLSGGVDSATTLGWAVREGFDCYALSFRYGQRHEAEVKAAQRVAESFRVEEHRTIEIDLRGFGKSALTGDIPVPKANSASEISDSIPVTYVPARNTIFLSFSLAWAEVLGAHDIAIGVNSLDYAGYPDCRPEYISSYERMANFATKAAVVKQQPLRIHTPLIQLTKAQILELGKELGVDYSLTSTCYDPTPASEACGHCDACLLRLQGFAEIGAIDPVPYAATVQSRR